MWQPVEEAAWEVDGGKSGRPEADEGRDRKRHGSARPRASRPLARLWSGLTRPDENQWHPLDTRHAEIPLELGAHRRRHSRDRGREG